MKLASLYVTVDDMDRALGFYERLFGIAPDVRDKRYSSFLLPKGGKFDLYYPAIDGDKRTIGTNVVPVFHSDDLDADWKRIKDLKADVVCEPMNIGEVRLFQFRDTEGNILEIYSEK
jgi:predicted enzyme related to lactoylglutathione lyase